MTLGRVCVMRRFLGITCLVMFSCLIVVLGRFRVVFCRLAMVFCRLSGHGFLHKGLCPRHDSSASTLLES